MIFDDFSSFVMEAPTAERSTEATNHRQGVWGGANNACVRHVNRFAGRQNRPDRLNVRIKKVLFFGDGSNKCKDVLTSGNAYFIDDFPPSATYMGILSLEKYNNKDFEDVAYFEPFYLKDFAVGKKN